MKNKPVVIIIAVIFIVIMGILGYIALQEQHNSNVANTNNGQLTYFSLLNIFLHQIMIPRISQI